MKLFIDYEIGESGKGKFLQRLIPELDKLGVKLVDKYKKADVALGVTWWRNLEHVDMPKVMRIDGIYLYEKKKNSWRNKWIAKWASRADAVIFQSNFCRDAMHKLTGMRGKKEFVIFNGADPSVYENVKHEPECYENIIMLCAKWKSRDERQHKRLKETILCAEGLGATVIVAGAVPDGFKNKVGLTFTGHLPEDVLRGYYKRANIYLHIPWYSWCDNSLIEAICAGCHVVGSNIGGNAEVINACGGTIVDIDKPIEWKIYKTNNPPEIDIDKVREAVNYALHNQVKPNATTVNISNIAKQYKKVFEEVLR